MTRTMRSTSNLLVIMTMASGTRTCWGFVPSHQRPPSFRVPGRPSYQFSLAGTGLAVPSMIIGTKTSILIADATEDAPLADFVVVVGGGDDTSIVQQLLVSAASTTGTTTATTSVWDLDASSSSLIDTGHESVSNMILRASDDPMVLLATVVVVVFGLVGVVVAGVAPNNGMTSTFSLGQVQEPSNDHTSNARKLNAGGDGLVKQTIEGQDLEDEQQRQQEQELLLLQEAEQEEEEDRKVLRRLSSGSVDAETPDDPWTLQGLGAMRAFRNQDRNQLRIMVGGMLGSLRSTQQEFDSERIIRQETEVALQVAGEQFRDLEDQYELGQNQLQRTIRALDETQSQLVQTSEKLHVTSQSLQELQQERQSLRKLGQVAWRLSKDRVCNRLAMVRKKFTKQDTTNDNDK